MKPEIDELINGIYSAAEDPSGWRLVLRRLNETVRATASAIVFEDLNCHTASVAEMVGFENPDWVGRYQHYYAARNPWMQAATRNELFNSGAVVTSQQVLPDTELLKTEYYNDFLRRLDLHNLTGAMLLQEPGALSHLSILRPRRMGEFGPREVRILTTITPHLRRAFRMHQKMAHAAWERDAIGEILDRVPVGVVLVGSGGKVLRVNRSASVILSSRDGLSLKRDSFVAVSSAETEALRRAVAVARGDSGATRSGGALTISRISERRPFSILVSPLISEVANFGVESPAAVLFITDPERHVEAGDLWRRLFGFTPAETALAARLADGTDLADAADELHITVGTARVHLKRLFDKTETHRQAELLRTLLLSGAVAGR